MKKLCALMVAIGMVFSCFGIASASEGGNNLELSLADAIDMALKDNPRIIANEYRQHGNDVNLDSAYLKRAPYKNMIVNVTNNFELYCLKEGYYIESAKMAQRLAVEENKKIRSSISYDVTQAYYNIVLIEKLCGAAQNAYNLALENKAIVDEQYRLGLIARMDYENAELSVVAAQNALNSRNMDLEIATENLKILLNLDDTDTSFVLTDEIECQEYASNPDEDVKKAMDTRYDVMALRENRDLASLYFDLTKVLTENSATYNSAYASYLEAESNYDSNTKLIGLSIRSSYNNVINGHANQDVAERQYYMALKEYEADKIKYDLGSISNMELTESINNLHDAQVAFANAKLNYRMAIEKYKYEITTGL